MNSLGKFDNGETLEAEELNQIVEKLNRSSTYYRLFPSKNIIIFNKNDIENQQDIVHILIKKYSNNICSINKSITGLSVKYNFITNSQNFEELSNNINSSQIINYININKNDNYSELRIDLIDNSNNITLDSIMIPIVYVKEGARGENGKDGVGISGKDGNDGRDGEDGKNGIQINLSPENIILTENTEHQIDCSEAYTTVSVVDGDINIANFEIISVESEECVVSYIDNKIKISSINKVNGVYFNRGCVKVSIKYNDIIYTRYLNFYVNLIGTWKEEIVGDTLTEIATQLEWDPNNQQGVNAINHIGQYIRSSKENISTIQSNIYDQQGNLTIATKTEVAQTSSGIISTVENLYGSGTNLLTGSETFTSSNKLIHKNSVKDGIQEYRPSYGYNNIHIYTAYDLIAGKEYVLQCKSDGNLAPEHYDDEGVDPTACYFTVWLRYFGDETHNLCFTSTNLALVESPDINPKSDGTYWWRFTPTISGTYYFRTNSYSDGNTEVEIKFWDIMLELADNQSPREWVEPPVNTTKSIINQAANNIKLAVGNTGIDIDNKKIILDAENTIINGDLSVKSINAGSPGNEPVYTQIKPGVFKIGVYEPIITEQEITGYTEKDVFSIGIDENGNYVLNYYDKTGNIIGSIGPSLFKADQAIGNSWEPLSLKKMSRRDDIEDNIIYNFNDVETIAKNNNPTSVYYKFTEGYIIETNESNGETQNTYNISRQNIPSDYNGKYFTATYTTDYLRSYEGNKVDLYIDNGWYVDPNSRIQYAKQIENPYVQTQEEPESGGLNTNPNSPIIISSGNTSYVTTYCYEYTMYKCTNGELTRYYINTGDIEPHSYSSKFGFRGEQAVFPNI